MNAYKLLKFARLERVFMSWTTHILKRSLYMGAFALNQKASAA